MLSDIQSIEDLKKIPVNQLPKLADEVRGKIIETIKENGGHLASNLGVVELTIALHYVFSSPTDKIIFDVGHQSYTHKILTGRYDKMDTLRQKDGLSGFSRRSESIHDPVDSGHASSSISQAAGFAQSNLLRGEDGRVIAVIGDGAMTGGVAMEGLNYCGQNRLPVIVVLNDNEMSIDCSVSPVSRYINHVAASERYRKFIDEMRHPLGRKFPLNRLFKKLFNKFEKGIRVLLDYDNLFTQMGFDYVGPIDGHNIEELIYILRKVQKQLTKPVLLYVKTKKGRGYKPAEDDPVSYHGVAPKFYLPKEKKRSYTEVFSAKLCELAEKHQDIVAITAAMESGTGLSAFHTRFPDRFFDVGITEQHAVTFASTLAYSGLHPVVAIYSTFFMRAVDQLCQDIAISNAPVILAIDRAGIVGMDGETHNGQFDLSIFRMFPQMTVLVPADGRELELMLEWAYSQKKAVAIRYPRDEALYLDIEHPPIDEENCFVNIQAGKDVLFIVVGSMLDSVIKAGEAAKAKGVECAIISLRFVKPLPVEKLLAEIKKYKRVVVVEENISNGSVAQELSLNMLKNEIFVPLENICIPDKFISHGSRTAILEELGFSKEAFLKLMIDK